ncbi:transmembrane signal receptor [Lithospermum erythrorhizon]|uniref:Transmembrane signal receptor n=1 Tax=Lithospermum erythrorhizon TaxID=34254 RepID=A0AAV3NU02_LITER
MKNYTKISIFSLVMSLFLFLDLVTSELQPNQTTIMTKLYDMLQNNSYIPPSSFAWNSVSKSSNPCFWSGVSCSNDAFITKLSFSSFQISSSDILHVVCGIDSLESLDLSNNHFSSITSEFLNSCGRLDGLKELNFSRNKLSGSLPSFQGFLKLELLDLSHNSLSGKVDMQLNDGLDSLKSLNLSFNQFNGYIPENLVRLRYLEGLQLSSNQFEGQIPANISLLENLSLIDLSGNKLSGSIPESFGNFPKLGTLVLSFNNLSGGIPLFLMSIKSLWRFAANSNRFSGNVPSEMTKDLKYLDLSYNELSGTIPESLLSWPNLEAIDLSYNNLEGPLPTNLSASLIRLRLGGNHINGTLPGGSLGRLQKLMYLEMENNTMVGGIPLELASCQKLALLNLAQNSLSGTLPRVLSNLTNLQELKLQQNKLSGEIPREIGRLQKLQKLNISWNSLNGTIPSEMTSLNSLLNLDLRVNNLSGRIPSTFSELQDLDVLDLSNNMFIGEIPESLTTLSGLSQLILTNNQLSGVKPKFNPFVIVSTEGNLDLKNATSPTTSYANSSTNRRKSVLIGVTIAVASAVFAVSFFGLVAVFIYKKYFKINDKQLHAEEELPQPQLIGASLLTENGIHRSKIDFTKAMEVVADELNVIMRTKFCSYYKAPMPSGTTYLVKKLKWSHKILQLGNHDKFGEELESLGKLSNSNVMIPLAYVLTVDDAYLFYDFIPYGTLFDALHGNSSTFLDWASRYSIALGVAQGVAFLHGCNRGPIRLLDLCSKSIFLKSENESMVADIELCKVIDPSKSTGSLSTIAGSIGYIPPEYAYTMRVTMAGNVYSFGVILLELVTGKPAVSQGTELTKLVCSNTAQQEKWDHVLDFSVSGKSPAVRSQMLAVLKVALACVNTSPEARPQMKSVLRMLLNSR